MTEIRPANINLWVLNGEIHVLDKHSNDRSNFAEQPRKLLESMSIWIDILNESSLVTGLIINKFSHLKHVQMSLGEPPQNLFP